MVLPVTGNPATSTTTTTTATPEQLASSVAVVPSASPIAAPIADSAIPAIPPQDAGWASRKLIAAVGSAVLSLVTAYSFLWFGHITEPAAVQLIEGSLILVGTYCGFNVVSQLVTVAGQVFGARK